MKKENKGITLVALVITIIVLIILAGVSINAVMSDGLIGNAKTAKNEWDEAKVEEQEEFANLEVMSMELEAKNDFKTKKTRGFTNAVEGISEHTPYLLSEGYLTGVHLNASNAEESPMCSETVGEFRNKLPVGYEIYDTKGNIITDETGFVETGFIIKNTEKDMRIARVVVYGDVGREKLNTTVNNQDLAFISRYLKK